MTEVLHGLVASPGIGIGTLVVYRPGLAMPLAQPDALANVDPETEWASFQAAQARVDAELESLGENANSLVSEIFAAHRLILHDETLHESVRRAIFVHNLDAVTATHKTITDLAELFSSFEDEYFAGRAIDILDLGQRLLVQLGAALSRPRLTELPPETILAAEDITPSELAELPPGHIQGIALAHSTPTAHSAILARSMGIPLVCTVGTPLLQLLPGETAIVDGNRGRFLADVDDDELARYVELQRIYLAEGAVALANAHAPAYTQDGVLVPVRGNANSPEEVAASRASGADGIGLLRTEYLFRGRAIPPSSAEQEATYVAFIEQVEQQLTVRALDAGGDKPVDYIVHHREDNPFLGLRGIRLLIAEPELLRTQYLALQAAAARANGEVEVRFMLPMISTVEEIQAVRALLAEIDATTGLPPLKLGVMIEVPSAALIARAFAPYVDFFSIGTNDLAQYVLAIDRTNSSVAKMADPLHPAVLALIQQTCSAAASAGKPVSLCGEVAGDPLVVPLLLGLGVTELSSPLPAVPLVKRTVRHVDMAHCCALAQHALSSGSAVEVRRMLIAHLDD